MSARRPKYGNVRTNGFASKKEARRHAELVLLEKAGQIRNLRCQVAYKLQANDVNLGVYRADFVYDERVETPAPNSDYWRSVVEDAKGYQTPVYRLKKRLMIACHRIEIRET